MNMTFAQTSEPAGGAALGDLVYASAAATVLTIVLLAVATGHRSGRIKWLGRLADFAAGVSGLPRWCALPSAVAGGALILAMFGFFWDVSVHIDNGRDSGPFGTPAHYAILAGIGGIALGGALTIILGGAEESPSSIKLGPGWHVPVGGVLIFAGGALAAARLPARRRVASPLRPGRDALGTDPRADGGQRRAVHARDLDPAHRGPARDAGAAARASRAATSAHG